MRLFTICLSFVVRPDEYRFQLVVPYLPPRRSGFSPRSRPAGFVVDKVVLAQVLSVYELKPVFELNPKKQEGETVF